MPRYCPSCNVVLTHSEANRGECSGCGATFGDGDPVQPPAHPVAPLRPVASTGGPISHARPSAVHKFLAVVLFLLTVGSFFLPWGTVMSILAGFSKGTTLCAAAGCHAPPTEPFKEYHVRNAIAPMLEERVGYCDAHRRDAPADISVAKGKSISILVTMVFVAGPALYLLWLLASLTAVFREEPDAQGAYLWFAFLGLVVVNAASFGYWHYCHFAFRHSGW